VLEKGDFMLLKWTIGTRPKTDNNTAHDFTYKQHNIYREKEKGSERRGTRGHTCA
jgi:hypothetical protein